jgi:hypothetical protein
VPFAAVPRVSGRTLKKTDDELSPWGAVKHLVNLPDRVAFSSDGMSFLMSLKESDLLNAVIGLDLLHNNLLDAMAAYNTERIDIATRLRGKVEGEGMASAGITLDEATALLPRMEALSALIVHIRDRARSEYDKANKVLVDLHRTLDGRLKLEFKLEPKAVPEPL